VLQRIGAARLGFSVLEGMLSTNARCMAVMDVDLQQDESILPTKLQDDRGGARCKFRGK
jgi:hypothetical protein